MNLNNKKIAILGLGIENLALVKYLLKHKIKCEIAICDKRSTSELGEKYTKLAKRKNISWQLGEKYNQGLEEYDILFRAPGWPIDCPGIQKALRQIKSPQPPLVKGGIILSSPMKLFFDLCPTKNIIGVTGTKGKGTTASLIYEIIKQADKKVWLGGNIGVAPFAFIDKIKKDDWVVLELSSFQLEDMTISPRIAVITNLFTEHLAPADPNNPNYHRTLEDYRRAKWNIAKWQKEKDYIILNSKFKIQNSKLQVKSQKLYFEKSNLPSKLIGGHNQENVAAAAAVAEIVGVKAEVIKKAVANFKGLEHRLELVREFKGVKYYDDSFATTPESAMLALKLFTAPIILLLGGADKGADFKALAQMVREKAKLVVLLKGDGTTRIRAELLQAGLESDSMVLALNMKTAVKAAARQAAKGEIVLLSTACASFGMFKNYKERGDLFKAEVRKLG